MKEETKSGQNQIFLKQLNLCFNKLRIELDILHDIYDCINDDFKKQSENNQNLDKCS